MDKQARQLALLIENLMYIFGVAGVDGECCENISHVEFRTLHTAMRQHNCTMQDIARKAVVTKSGATRIVRRLEDKGLARRVEDPKDGRICCVILSEAGKSLLKRIEDQLTYKMETILAVMDPALREVLIISLGAFLQSAQGQVGNLDRQREAKDAKENKQVLSELG